MPDTIALIGLSLSELYRRIDAWRAARAIVWEERHISAYDKQIKDANRGIAECKKRLLELRNR